MDKNPLWETIQAYMDDPKHRYPPKPADLARETGISEQVLSKWKAKAVLPEAALLLAFAYGTGIEYEVLLRAALQGRAYLPPGSELRVPAEYENWLRTNPNNVTTMERFIARRTAAGAVSDPSDTTDSSMPLVADEDPEPIERGQGHDDDA